MDILPIVNAIVAIIGAGATIAATWHAAHSAKAASKAAQIAADNRTFQLQLGNDGTQVYIQNLSMHTLKNVKVRLQQLDGDKNAWTAEQPEVSPWESITISNNVFINQVWQGIDPYSSEYPLVIQPGENCGEIESRRFDVLIAWETENEVYHDDYFPNFVMCVSRRKPLGIVPTEFKHDIPAIMSRWKYR